MSGCNPKQRNAMTSQRNYAILTNADYQSDENGEKLFDNKKDTKEQLANDDSLKQKYKCKIQTL